MKRMFKWAIRRGASLSTVCHVLRVTWCHSVCFSCYFRQNGATVNVLKFELLTSRQVMNIWCYQVELTVNPLKFM